MTGDARTFRLEIARELDLQLDQARDVVALLALQGLRGVVQKSPVDTGRFKGNWFLSVGTINATATEMVDPGGGATISRGAQSVAAYAASEGFPMIHIQNNLPYAVRLEKGWSAQAPGGMVALTAAELQAQFNAMGPL